jgi:hypothetical protein
VSLLRDVLAVLERHGIRHALIGAAAMAVHGVSRATADTDLLTVTSIGEVTLPVARVAGVLLKLLAGGPKDAWDVRALLDAHPPGETLRAEVAASLPRLPADARRLWSRILDEA